MCTVHACGRDTDIVVIIITIICCYSIFPIIIATLYSVSCAYYTRARCTLQQHKLNLLLSHNHNILLKILIITIYNYIY